MVNQDPMTNSTPLVIRGIHTGAGEIINPDIAEINIYSNWRLNEMHTNKDRESYSFSFDGAGDTNLTLHDLEISRFNTLYKIKPIPEKIREKEKVSTRGPKEKTLVDTSLHIIASDYMNSWSICHASFLEGKFKHGVFFTNYGPGLSPTNGVDAYTARDFGDRFCEYLSTGGKEIRFDDFKLVFNMEELPQNYRDSIRELIE
tara:strand:- start:1914 stop:2519 length:606 start_codon:yes stop_codon:yes gene_type:complete